MASDAKMLIAADDRQWGTIGGGCVEADVIGQALAVAERGQPVVVSHTLNADVAGDIGLSCGGTADFFLEPVVSSEEMARLYGVVADAISNRRPTTVTTALDWSGGPRKVVVIESERRDGAVFPAELSPEPREERWVEAVGSLSAFPEPADSAASQAPVYFDEAAGLLVEQLPRMPRVVVFGAGHVGVEIAKIARGVGFYVVVIDDRADFANREHVPWAHEVIAEDFRTVLDRLRFDADDCVLATTRGHSFDAYIVERTAGSPARYIGMLGSRRKQAVILRALEKAGVPPEDLRRVKTPIGLDIGADTPAEIAVSVVAELIRVRRLGEVR
jgi:xanthine dehydrogenase accessory factor